MGGSRETIYFESIGFVEKQGKMLNLGETHDIICKKEYNITYCYDPITNVELTKCIFNFIINQMEPKKLCTVVRSS